MKVLLVTAEPPCPPLNGLGKFVWDFAREAASFMELKVLSLQLDPFLIPPDTLPAMTDGQRADYAIRVEADGYTEDPEARHLLAAHKALPAIEVVLEEFKPDIIYIHSLKAWMPFRYKRNVVMAFHSLTRDIIGTDISSSFMAFQEKLEVEAAHRCAAVVFFSRFMEERWALAYGTSCRNVRLPLGIDGATYRSEKSADTFNLAYFGRLKDKHKGYSLFLEATRELPKQTGDGRKVQIHVYGDGETIDLAEHPHALFHGHLAGQNLIDAFASTDCVVMPSRYEPFGIVGLEAMASGAILLAPRGQGMDEYLRFGINSVEIDASADSIRDRLLEIIEAPSSYASIAQRAEEDASVWSLSASIRSHLAFFVEKAKELEDITQRGKQPSVGRMKDAERSVATPCPAPV